MYQRLHIFDYNELTVFYSQREKRTVNMLGCLHYTGMINRRRNLRCATYYGKKSAGKLVGVLAVYNDGNAFFYSDEGITTDVLSLLDKLNWHTFFDYSQVYMDDFREALGQPITMFLMEQPYTRHEIHPEREIYDARLMSGNSNTIRFISHCVEECFGFSIPFDLTRRRLRERGALEPHFIICTEGTPVGQAHIQAVTEHYGVIGGVAVLKQFRGNGLAKDIVLHTAAYIHELGRVPLLTVLADNVPAIRLYESLNFQTTGQVLYYKRPIL